MIKLLIKKSFFETWDNLFKFILLNVGFIVCLVVTAALPMLAGTGPSLMILLLSLPGLLLLHFYNGAVSMIIFDVSDYRSISFKRFTEGFLKTWKASIVLALLNTAVLILLFVAIPFYFSMGNIISLLGGGLLMWVGLSWLMSSQLFFPVLIRMDCSIRAALKKSVLITLDNPGHLFFILLYSFLLCVISIFLFLIIPGISAVLILHHNSLKLLLYKYDWKEENPESGSKVPWSEILKEEDEKTGSRTLKGLIFPWKD